MSDFTKEQIEQIHDAYVKAYAHLNGNNPSPQLLIAELTNKPTFEVGQVSMCSNQGEKEWPYVWDDIANLSKSVRPLNQTECGPYPRAMHEYVKKMASNQVCTEAKGVFSQMPEGWDE